MLQAFLMAWNEACSSETENPTLIIPRLTFLVSPVVFRGPCKAKNINFLVWSNVLVFLLLLEHKNYTFSLLILILFPTIDIRDDFGPRLTSNVERSGPESMVGFSWCEWAQCWWLWMDQRTGKRLVGSVMQISSSHGTSKFD